MNASDLIERCENLGEFITGDDGYVVWWPKGLNGAVSAWALRALADELDRRNAAWHEQICRDIGGEDAE